MAKKKAATRGGKREGAGRKASPEGAAVLITASVPGEVAEQFDQLRE